MKTLLNQLHTAPGHRSNMVIVLTGGGSGGHITPLLSVADELKKHEPDTWVIYIGQKGDKLHKVPSGHRSIDKVITIRAGKFRRYHGAGLSQLLDVGTLLKNIRDFFYFCYGTLQSIKILRKLKPDAVFIKGGLVGVPVGLAAAINKIPYVTHDSDAIPGLANRIIARWASAHAVAMPKKLYKYPADKTYVTGVPVSHKYAKITKQQTGIFKKSLGYPKDTILLLITGGGLGAKRLNEAFISISGDLLKNNDKLYIAHATGPGLENDCRSEYEQKISKNDRARIKVDGFFNNLYEYSGAASIIITRAGATTLAEFATQNKACVVIPNPDLTGGHQLKNAQVLADNSAAVVLKDSETTANPQILKETLIDLLNNKSEIQKLANNIGKFAHPRASKDLADLIMQTANRELR